jgi:CheY-like chemotaxis protein
LPQRSKERKAIGKAPATDAAAAHFSSLPSLEDVKVLLVDDDEDTLQLLGVMLTGSKANVQTACSVEAAMAVLEWFRPDVVVSDLAMPGEDGYALIKKLRALEDSEDIPAVALTSYVRVEDRTRALSAGFNMFVPKPVEPEELITVIANLAEEPN